jgi:fructose-specific component phosphotransferase system IIB-like protein
MAQTSFTPIQLYSSSTATNVPLAANLAAGELAINTFDGKLFYKDSSGVVQVLATKNGVNSTSDTQVLYNSSGALTGSANLTFNGTKLTMSQGGVANYTDYTSVSQPSYAQGRVWYDTAKKALAYFNDVSSAVVHIGQDLQIKVINNTGSTIANGAPVYITSGSSGFTYPNVALAKADAAGTAVVLGLVNGAITNGSIGYVSAQGTIDNVNTSSYTVGQVLYLSPYSAGQLQNTIPPTGITVQVGVVTYVDSSIGTIYVKQTTPLNVPASIISGTLAAANGGTGQSSYTVGDILAASTTTALSKVSPGTAGQLLTSAGSSTLPTWSALTSVALTTGTITTAPTNGTDIVNKTYADSIATGINFHSACNYATVAALSPANTYNNGTSGVGATLTGNSNGILTIDGHAITATDATNGVRVLVKDEATGSKNGVYVVTQAGTAGLPYILTRATDYDTSGTGTNEIDAGDFLLILSGSTLANTSWVQQTALPITIGTTAIVFTQFAAVQTYTAGTGLSLSTNQFSITNTTVTAASYGAADKVGTFTVNAQGQLTAASDTSIAISAAAVTSGTLTAARGGTGNSSYAVGDILYASATTPTLSKLALGSAYNILSTNSGATSPEWKGLSSLLDNSFTASAQGTILYRGSTAWTALAPSTSGYVLKTQGASADPLWGAIGGVTSFSAGTTGFSPSSATAGAVTLSGTLNIGNGGTGATTLAGASIATYTGTETLTNKRIQPRVTSAASASSLTPDISTTDIYAYTALAANLTINAPTGTPVDGEKLMFRILDNGTARTLTWNATFTSMGISIPTTTVANKTTYVGAIYNANNTRWDVIAVTTQA